MSTQKLEDYVQSSKPLLLVVTSEPEYAIKRHATTLSKVALLDDNGRATGHYNLATWSFHQGIRKISIEGKQYKIGDTEEGTKGKPETALKFIEEAQDNTVLFVKSFHFFLDREEKYPQRASYIEKLRDLISICNSTNKAIVFVDTKMNVPEELSRDILSVDFSLPTKAELQNSLKLVCESTRALMPTGKELDSLLDALLGMSKQNAEDALSLSLVVSKKFDEDLIRKEKANIVAQSKVLEVIDTPESLDTIAGMENAKALAELEKECFDPAARTFGVEPIKGVFLVGEPGTGKSLFAKALANIFRRNLLRLDMANVRDKYVGGSESLMKEGLATAAALSPCVLWI
jgi:SpoVK/Ycf46/Vps4 family AAA+-type ATPase